MATKPALVIVLLCGSLLAACHPVGGGESARDNEPPAADEVNRIPLGAPPGQGIAASFVIKNPFEGSAEAIAQGKALFTAMNCVYCHGSQGAGMIGPTLQGPGWRYGGTPAQIYNSIHDGRPKGMPAWGQRLPSDQIWQLTAYIESLGGAKPPATSQMRDLGGDVPSTTGPEVAGQSQTDTAEQAVIAGQQRSSR